jgi:SAM-dependent methyltransferase
MSKAIYKTWIRTKVIFVFAILTFVSFALSLLGFINTYFLLFVVLTVIFGYILLIVGISWLRFSSIGGDYQNKIHSLIVSKVEGKRILDIGCGSGHLLSMIARQMPTSELVGIDYWGKDWEYSRELCLNNFRADNIRNKVDFRKETASKIPDDLGSFDCIVSCLTFHEVSDVSDKTVSIKEALKCLRPEGKFIFLDLFKDKKYYPDYKRIDNVIEDNKCLIIERVGLGEIIQLPYPLKHGKVLGNAELIVGKKNRTVV